MYFQMHIEPGKNIAQCKCHFNAFTSLYEHPLFDVPAIRSQEELHRLNETGPVYFCGSYFRYGFHEDAYMSAVELCSKL